MSPTLIKATEDELEKLKVRDRQMGKATEKDQEEMKVKTEEESLSKKKDRKGEYHKCLRTRRQCLEK